MIECKTNNTKMVESNSTGDNIFAAGKFLRPLMAILSTLSNLQKTRTNALKSLGGITPGPNKSKIKIEASAGEWNNI